MNILKKVHHTFSTKKDIDIVVSYVKASLKFNLDCARFEQNTKNKIHQYDKLLTQAEQFKDSIVKNIDEINKFARNSKETVKKSKNIGISDLSPDETFAIDMSTIKDIKKSGLKRKLTKDERKLLKNATLRFGQVYSEQVKGLKSKDS